MRSDESVGPRVKTYSCEFTHRSCVGLLSASITRSKKRRSHNRAATTRRTPHTRGRSGTFRLNQSVAPAAANVSSACVPAGTVLCGFVTNEAKKALCGPPYLETLYDNCPR